MNKYTNEVCVLSIRAEFAMLCYAMLSQSILRQILLHN